ncbi:MAG: YeeE/YedE family protein [Rhodospirillales bacterium]|nr:YeeE/YedE family protein [Rhodospirillales bacterium]
MDEMPVTTVVAALGFLLGIVFGATAQRSRFCAMGAVSDIVLMGEWNRFRAWLLAIAVATLGSQILHGTGAVDLGESIYVSGNLGWAGGIVGGALFGFGMTLTGGCGNRTLVRLGAGNLKSAVVMLFLGIFAYVTLSGLLAPARIALDGATRIDVTSLALETHTIPDILTAGGLAAGTARWVAVIAVAGGMLVFCFKSAAFRASPLNIAAGLVIGVLVTAAWAVTGIAGFDNFELTPLASVTFVAPVGEAILYLMTFTEASDMVRNMIGGAMMGVGGVLALGCTIGQGITGMSTLALGSVIAWLSIITGGILGVKFLEEGSLGGAFRALVARG